MNAQKLHITNGNQYGMLAIKWLNFRILMLSEYKILEVSKESKLATIFVVGKIITEINKNKAQ